MSTEPGLVVIGGSHAGHLLAITARNMGYEKSICILSDEEEVPYQRPPLSKAYLLGKVDRAGLLFRPASFYADKAIELKLGTIAQRIDPVQKQVELSDGDVIDYETLALATGARVRPFPAPGADLAGIHYIRTLDDIDHLFEDVQRAQDVVVIGGGFIGLEAAAAIRSMGKTLTVIEASERLMARGVGQDISEFFADEYHKQGVKIRLNCGVQALSGETRVDHVIMQDGTHIKADLVIVGIGVIPNQELAEQAGLACENGILVDLNGRTSDPNVYAAGDCTRFTHPFTETSVRLESVQNAADQARSVGSAIAGVEKPYDSVPWFWSDQFDLKLQMVGLTQPYDDSVTLGHWQDRAFSVFYFKDGRWIGTDSVNRPTDHMAARRIMQARYALSKKELSGGSDGLKALAKTLAAKPNGK